MPLRRNWAQSQLLDTGADTEVVTSGGAVATTLFATGTVFPLLRDQAYRIFNVSSKVFPDTDLTCEVLTLQAFVSFLDTSNNVVAQLILAAKNYTIPAKMGSGFGFAINADGDPLTEFVSGFGVTGYSSPSGPTIASFQLAGGADVVNTDLSDHSCTLQFSALISVVPRT